MFFFFLCSTLFFVLVNFALLGSFYLSKCYPNSFWKNKLYLFSLCLSINSLLMLFSFCLELLFLFRG